MRLLKQLLKTLPLIGGIATNILLLAGVVRSTLLTFYLQVPASLQSNAHTSH